MLDPFLGKTDWEVVVSWEARSSEWTVRTVLIEKHLLQWYVSSALLSAHDQRPPIDRQQRAGKGEWTLGERHSKVPSLLLYNFVPTRCVIKTLGAGQKARRHRVSGNINIFF